MDLLARSPTSVILCCRTEAKGLAAAEEVMKSNPSSKGNSISVQILDLNDLESVMTAAECIRGTLDGAPLDFLVLNAGVIARTLKRTVQGYEEGWGVNFVGHYVMTQKLLPLTTEQSRIVAVSSVAHMICKQIDDDVNFEHGRRFSGWQSYGQSKLGLLLYMKYLARNPSLFKGKAYSVHPGAIATPLQDDTVGVKLAFKMFAWLTKTPEQGAATTVFACTEFVDLPNGAYLKNCRDAGIMMGKQGHNAANGDKMVALVEQSLKSKFPEYFEQTHEYVEAKAHLPPVPVTRKSSSKAARLASMGTADSEHSDGCASRKDSIQAIH